MRFEQAAVPRRRLRAGRKRHVGGSVRTQVGAIPPMEVDRSDIDFLDVPLPDEAQPVEALIADTGTGNSNPSLGVLEIGWRLPELGKSAYAHVDAPLFSERINFPSELHLRNTWRISDLRQARPRRNNMLIEARSSVVMALSLWCQGCEET